MGLSNSTKDTHEHKYTNLEGDNACSDCPPNEQEQTDGLLDFGEQPGPDELPSLDDEASGQRNDRHRERVAEVGGLARPNPDAREHQYQRGNFHVEEGPRNL